MENLERKAIMIRKAKEHKLVLEIPVEEYRSITIPGLMEQPKIGDCFVRVTDLPQSLDSYMEINPRVPNRTKKGILSGPVVKGIIETLIDKPDEMAVKNQGIYILVDTVEAVRKNDKMHLTITLTDPGRHGIVNGGHTYAAIREAIETSSEESLKFLQRAFVRLHLVQGIDADMVPEMAEGLNRSKQVDDPSLTNLQGEFDVIRKTMKGKPGENAIAYHQGDEGELYISDVLVYLAFFNPNRFNDRKQPNQLYKKQALGLKYFKQDMDNSRAFTQGLIEKLPDLLWLSDTIKKMIPQAAKHNNFHFGRIKLGASRAGSTQHRGTYLPFIDERVDYRVPNGWVYPMLAAFRANLKPSEDGKSFTWRVPLKELLSAVIDDLVAVCVTEHKDNNMRPERIGNRESAYSQCYREIQLYLAKKRLL